MQVYGENEIIWLFIILVGSAICKIFTVADPLCHSGGIYCDAILHSSVTTKRV